MPSKKEELIPDEYVKGVIEQLKAIKVAPRHRRKKVQGILEKYLARLIMAGVPDEQLKEIMNKDYNVITQYELDRMKARIMKDGGTAGSEQRKKRSAKGKAITENKEDIENGDGNDEQRDDDHRDGEHQRDGDLREEEASGPAPYDEDGRE